ncbi:MAG TPA: ImmA/IrrE family metallo-endopeptidase [Phycisphaerae bacterium]|nr:ImmA/IrrE family metallo-endopeptidase [Phycisphaerae bacterium]HDZ42972.1 ImmA/IrrE family metallo-endopeptidase [Phycisphaerae bacterium]
MTPRPLERRAIIAALKVRQGAGVPDDVPICSYDFAVKQGVAVRFMPISSMEGIYDRHSKTIVISSLRPWGRRAFTCAHEYGHHVFGHGAHVDELPEERQEPRAPEELLADRFAGFLLMPRLAVLDGFRKRGVDPSRCGPTDAYMIACWLGVSYGAFLTHASLAVGVMPKGVADGLRRVSPKEVKAGLAPGCLGDELIVVDEHWANALDLVVGDIAMLPGGTIVEGAVTETINKTSTATYVRATSRGIGRALLGQWAVSIRVMPAEYTGLARCRHIPEEDNA